MNNIHLPSDKIILIGHNFFLSNSVLATWVAMFILISLAGIASFNLKKGNFNKLVLISKLIINFFYRLIEGIVENSRLAWLVLPLIATLFLYITGANWLALIPGFIGGIILQTPEGNIPIFRSINADLNTTSSMAITSIILLKIFSYRFPETKDYLRIGVNKVIHSILVFFEGLSELTRIISLTFRLSGNVFAGEVLLLVIGFIVPYFVPIPFMFLEFFIGFFQAFIFSVLILIFVKW